MKIGFSFQIYATTFTKSHVHLAHTLARLFLCSFVCLFVCPPVHLYNCVNFEWYAYAMANNLNVHVDFCMDLCMYIGTCMCKYVYLHVLFIQKQPNHCVVYLISLSFTKRIAYTCTNTHTHTHTNVPRVLFA